MKQVQQCEKENYNKWKVFRVGAGVGEVRGGGEQMMKRWMVGGVGERGGWGRQGLRVRHFKGQRQEETGFT